MKAVDIDQCNGVRGEEVDKKKKRRSNRKSKQTSHVTEPLELARNGGTSSKQLPTKASDIAFNSLPTMHLNGKAVPPEGRITQNRQLFSSDSDGRTITKSCPETIACEDALRSYPSNRLTLQQNSPQRELFAPHWPVEVVKEALEKGHVFKARFHVNAHNRLEAYCKIDGIQTDVLISGIEAQNRAVEGDTVAIKVDPLSLWTRMKGSLGTSCNSASLGDGNSPTDNLELNSSCKVKNKVEDVYDSINESSNYSAFPEGVFNDAGTSSSSLELNGHYVPSLESGHSQVDRDYPFIPNPSAVVCDRNDVGCSLEKLCAVVNSFPSKRPTGRVVSIIEGSPRRDAVVGFLNVKQCSSREVLKKENKEKNSLLHPTQDYIMLIPNDPKFTKMMVFVSDLPPSIVKRLEEGDTVIEKELVAACVSGWEEGNFVPHARVVHIFGRGGEIEPHVAAILFENGINTSEFSSQLLASLPRLSWKIPLTEFRKRRDLRNLCTFTIDSSTATDLDDALSVERLPNGIFRVGVHIADVSYFILPDSALDIEAHVRATSVYLSLGKLPMLPSSLSENVGSLNPGINKLAFSIIWDINLSGEIVDQWIGRTIIHSCCKLSYRNAQDIIDGLFLESGCVQVRGNFEWSDVCGSVRNLFEISKTLKENRYNAGALCLNNSKFSFLLDDDGIPHESKLSEMMDSNFLVEEFMLLANKAAAEVIYKAYPDSALLRKHPEPNLRKVKEFEAFCIRSGLEVDTSSSAQFHRSMEGFRVKLENDPVLFNILVNYATKSMQLATYFCSGELKDNEEDLGHYALGVPLYTHFTSPLRRYADIVVHRTLAAVIEAEEMYLKLKRTTQKGKDEKRRCFTGVCFDKVAAESPEGKAALSAAASRHRVPCTEILADIATHCNERKLACRNVKDASDKLFMWLILKKKQILLTEARVLTLGPRFMSIYVPRLAIERRICYDEVEDLMVEWLDATSTLLLSLSTARKRFQRRGSPGNRRTLEDVALITCPLKLELDYSEGCGDKGFENKNIDLGDKSENRETEPAVFPLKVSLLSTLPVALHAVGGDDGPLDIGARLYMSTYLR